MIVTNVGDENSTCVISVPQILRFHMVVQPMELIFTKANQQAKYMISFTRRVKFLENLLNDLDHEFQKLCC